MKSILKERKKIIFIGIFLLAIFLRFYQLGTNPPSLDWDEASIGYNAYSILKTGADEYGNTLPLSFRSFDDYKPPVYFYLAVPSVAIFGLTEFAVRLPAAVIGVIAVIAVYFLILEVLTTWNKREKEWIALTAAFFLTISPWHLQFSRAAFEGNLGICFLILALLFFFKAIKSKKHYFLFALFFVLSIYSYHSFRLINPVILIMLSLFYFKDFLKNRLIIGATYVLIILACLPIYTSFIQQQGTGARLSMVTIFSDPKLQQLSAEQVSLAKQNNDVLKQVLYNRRFIFIPEIINGYFDHFNFDFLFLHGDSGVQHHAYNMGMLYLWDFPFILIGMVYLFKKRNKRILLLFLLFFLAPLPAAITTGTPHPVRAIAMIPAFQIFTAVGFVMTGLLLWRKKYLGKFFLGIIALLFIYNVGCYFYSYYVYTPIKYGYFWQYGNKQAILYAKQHENEYNNIIMTYQYDQPYVYYLFYDKIDPVWYQHHWNYSGSGTLDRFYRKIGKYEFMNITAKKFTQKKTLLIGSPAEIPDSVGQLKEEIYFPDGRVAYRIVAL